MGEGEEGDGTAVLEGPGWVIQLTGYHYHNLDQNNQTRRFVNNTLIKNLEERTVQLPDGPDGQMIDVPLADLRISHPWVVEGKPLRDEVIDPNAPNEFVPGVLAATVARDMAAADTDGEGGYGGSRNGASAAGRGEADGQAEGNEKLPLIHLKRYDFVVEFFWQPTPRSERVELARQRKEQQEAAAAEALLSGAEAASEDAVEREPPVDAGN